MKHKFNIVRSVRLSISHNLVANKDAKKEVANKDLWWELIPFFEKFGYDFRKVKGHATCVWNNKCDELAQKAAEEAKINWRGKENE